MDKAPVIGIGDNLHTPYALFGGETMAAMCAKPGGRTPSLGANKPNRGRLPSKNPRHKGGGRNSVPAGGIRFPLIPTLGIALLLRVSRLSAIGQRASGI